MTQAAGGLQYGRGCLAAPLWEARLPVLRSHVAAALAARFAPHPSPASTPAAPAVKRMSEGQLAQLAQLSRDIALHRSDADMQVSSPAQSGASARDLLQPFFALAAAEVVWRCHNPARYVSAETVSAVITCGEQRGVGWLHQC